ncbi:SDR family NAD(P)-dependent oxidoreductase [Labrys wisconsinensis]|uniref:NADP-dependent 3-hydroxy acid dehydrogenase YdfG n=1 Tax=Labrys wisconsinensis TaxID=425677 RepID=A0ABU0JHW4_9HYPH|nr:SDR family oxidoreductase [Labrys wisconsinensis]MDQ0472712.1 short-subunit dehydrogenase [Labrys wisconsinensis]
MTIPERKGTALITGASTGIGAVYADRLAKRGYDLVLVARNQGRLLELAKRLEKETGRLVETLVADLNDQSDIRQVEERLKGDRHITMLVNNAGVGSMTPLLSSDIDKMEEMISLNVGALTRLTYAAAPGFAARGGGTLINIASIVGIAPERMNGVYGATKAFVLALSQSLQHELADKGVRVQAVLPGATATPFWDIAGVGIHNLPASIVMTAEDMVDASLAGLDQGEIVTIPALPDLDEWNRYEAARRAMAARLSSSSPAARYGIAAKA